MKKATPAPRPSRIWPWLLPFLLALLLLPGRGQPAAAALPRPASPSMPLRFVENRGQFGPGPRFQLQAGGATYWFTDEAIWLTLASPEEGEWATAEAAAEADDFSGPPLGGQGVNLRLTFAGSSPAARLEPANRLPLKQSYFTGGPAQWRAAVPVWGRLRYVDLYPGLDLEIGGEEGALAMRLVCRHSCAATLPQARLDVAGADSLALAPHGDALLLRTPLGEWPLPLPMLEGASGPQPAAQVAGSSLHHPFATRKIAPAAPQDAPASGAADLAYSTFVGGSTSEFGISIIVDDADRAYVAGWTSSVDFPQIPGPFSLEGTFKNAYVVRVSPDGTSLDYSVVLGGTGDSSAIGVRADASGRATFSGYSDAADFPVTPGAFDTSHNGDRDVFLGRLSPDGTSLEFATFLGGTGEEEPRRLVVLDGGQTVLTGFTYSTDFPVTPGAYDTTQNGDRDAFLARFTADGSAVDFVTYLGGTGTDTGYSLALDAAGIYHVTGRSSSTDMPTTPGAYDTTWNGDRDVFILKLSPDGSQVLFGTYYGGGMEDYAVPIKLDSAGNMYIGGTTFSSDLPTTPGAFQETYGGGGDGFISKFSADGSTLLYGNFVGGSGEDKVIGLGVNSAGNAYGAGFTGSTDLPVTAGAFDTTANGVLDAYVYKLSADGSALAYGTYLGGTGDDHAKDMAIDNAGNAYATGRTRSSDFPTSAGAFDTSYNGSFDNYVTKLLMGNPAVTIYFSAASNGNIGGGNFADEDILAYDAFNQSWSKFFDGSDVGLGGVDVDAFILQDDGSLLLSLDAPATLPDVGAVDDSDILRFVPTSLGNQTAGTFEMVLDGSDVGLETAGEDIDALAMTATGELLISTLGDFTLSLGSGTSQDLLRFSPTTLGWDSAGTWGMYVDGSDIGLDTPGENIWGAWLDDAGNLYATTRHNFSLPGLSGDGSDIFRCLLTSPGWSTACDYEATLYWDGSASALAGQVLDAIAILPQP